LLSFLWIFDDHFLKIASTSEVVVLESSEKFVDPVDTLILTGNPSEKETEQITQLWQSSLFNAHYDVQR